MTGCIDSKIDVLLETDILLTIQSKVFAQNEEILTIDSKLDVIDDKVDVAIEISRTIESKIDEINLETDQTEKQLFRQEKKAAL